MKKKTIYILIAITIFSIICKMFFLNFKSDDYINVLSKWIDKMAKNGVTVFFKGHFADYNYPYLIFLSIVSYLPTKLHLLIIKGFSLLFDLLIAILGIKFISKYSKISKQKISLRFIYIILLLNPIIFLDSCVWGQCDSIYSFFMLLSLYYLCEEKINRSFISIGIAFSLKLQTVFIFPLFIIMLLCNNKVKLYHFLIIPVMNFIMCIPAYIVGGNPLYTYKVYLFQTHEYLLRIDTINIYVFLSKNSYIFYIGIIITLIFFTILLIKCYKYRHNLNCYRIIDLAVLSLFICYLFLPSMHERYSYFLEIMLVMWVFVYNKKYYLFILTSICSIIMYSNFLFKLGLPKLLLQFLSIIYITCFFSFLKSIIAHFNNKSIKEK